MKIIVGVADMKTTFNPGDELITYALGSCIAVTMYSIDKKIGGMIHFMLPDSSIENSASINPYMFADTGIVALFKKMKEYGIEKERIIINAAGGASIINFSKGFNIGQRNILAFTSMLKLLGLKKLRCDLGGSFSRTLRLKLSTGEVLASYPNGGQKIL